MSLFLFARIISTGIHAKLICVNFSLCKCSQEEDSAFERWPCTTVSPITPFAGYLQFFMSFNIVSFSLFRVHFQLLSLWTKFYSVTIKMRPFKR